MDYFEAETKQQELLRLISSSKSPREILFESVKFIKNTLASFDPQIVEPFICEILPNFNQLLHKFSPYGFEPDITEEILTILEKIKTIDVYNTYLGDVQYEMDRIKNELETLKNALNGEVLKVESSNKFHFPVIEKTNKNENEQSLLDSLEVTLVRNKILKENEFLLHPSAIDVEERINNQITKSWNYAKMFLFENFHKKLPKFQVVVKFEKPYGIYEGASLGIALTIAFISRLINYFELRDSIHLKNSIASTGEVDENGDIHKMSKEIIKAKLKSVFFSNISIFIIPKDDELYASKYLDKLKEKYPNRRLDIIGAKNISDILDRRNLIDIKKTNIVYWGAKKIVTNKLSSALLILLILLLVGFYYWNYDSNPSKLEFNGRYVLIKNKYDKTLWEKEFTISPRILQDVDRYTYNKARIIDVNDDGINEVLIANYKNNYFLTLCDHEGNKIWQYTHTDSLETNSEKFTGIFIVQGIIDTIHNGKVKELIIYFQHHSYYPVGVTKLNLETGKRISDILWHPGSIGGAALLDWNGDGKKEIIAGGASNGMHCAFLFSIDHDKLHGTFPTSKNYYFKDLELADFNKYILISQTDYGKYFFPKYSAVLYGPSTLWQNFLSIHVYEGIANLNESNFSYYIKLHKDLTPRNVVIGDAAITVRDKLVKSGILNPPLTDTPEFHNSIMNNIRYWDGKKFVSFSR